MDLQSAIDTLEGIQELGDTMETIGTGLSAAMDMVKGYLPQDALDQVASLLPTDLTFASAMPTVLLFALGALILGTLGRLFLGQRSSLNHALSAAMAILFVYALTMVGYTFWHWDWVQSLSPLPFVAFAGDYMVVFPLENAAIPGICYEILSLVVLSFLVNLLDSILPRGENVLSWFLLRGISVVLSMGLHILAKWAISAFLPAGLVTYAPVILLGLLVGMVLLGALNLILSVLLVAVNPIIGALYAFFFSNIIGKQLTKAIFTTAILVGLVYVLGHFDYTIINISMASLTSYLPVALVSLGLWFLIGNVL